MTIAASRSGIAAVIAITTSVGSGTTCWRSRRGSAIRWHGDEAITRGSAHLQLGAAVHPPDPRGVIHPLIGGGPTGSTPGWHPAATRRGWTPRNASFPATTAQCNGTHANGGVSVRRDGHTVAVTVPSRSKTEAEVTAQTDHMSDLKEPKAALQHYLQSNRDALLWKLDGLGERHLRMPRTPTGTNLIGIVKHMANVEIGYFADTFGREWPTPDERISDENFEADPQADWYATESETCDGIIDLYRRVWTFADATIEELPLDALGRVPWWPEDRNPVTLERILVHVIVDLARHVGHADILREQIDGAVGLRAEVSNLPEQQDWPAYVAKLTALAERF